MYGKYIMDYDHGRYLTDYDLKMYQGDGLTWEEDWNP